MNDLVEHSVVTSYECGANHLLRLDALLHYCQEMAENHASVHGFGYDWAMEQGLAWVEVRAEVEVLRYPRWKEKISLRTNTGKASALQAMRFVEMRAEESGELLARVDLLWVLIDIKRRRPMPFKKVGLDVEAQCTPTVLCEAPAAQWAEAPTAVIPHVASERDVDFVGHINNASYLIWALDSLPQEMRPSGNPMRLSIAYKKETMAGEPVSIEHWSEAKTTRHLINSELGLRAEMTIAWSE